MYGSNDLEWFLRQYIHFDFFFLLLTVEIKVMDVSELHIPPKILTIICLRKIDKTTQEFFFTSTWLQLYFDGNGQAWIKKGVSACVWNTTSTVNDADYGFNTYLSFMAIVRQASVTALTSKARACACTGFVWPSSMINWTDNHTRNIRSGHNLQRGVVGRYNSVSHSEKKNISVMIF